MRTDLERNEFQGVPLETGNMVPIDPLASPGTWIMEGENLGDRFGYSVSSAGDVNGDGYDDVIVGAYYANNSHGLQAGKVFVYYGSASGLADTPAWTVDGDQAGAWFGYSVSSAGDVNGDGFSDVIVGSPFYDDNTGKENVGRAFVYYGSAGGLSLTPDWIVDGDNQEGERFGNSVSSAGDVNGDGNFDVIIGALCYDTGTVVEACVDTDGQADEGSVYVYYGSEVEKYSLADPSSWTVKGDQPQAWFGASVSSAGDVDGDTYDDVIVGAPLYNINNTDKRNVGRASVYYGSNDGLHSTDVDTIDGHQADARFGYSVSSAGNVNGDAFDDVIIGAVWYDKDPADTDENTGRAYVFHGSVDWPASRLATTAHWTAESDKAGANFGWSVSGAGDVDDDTFDDVIVGAVWDDDGEGKEGRAYVYHGSASRLSEAPGWSAGGDQPDAWFGWSVSSAGDINKDGLSDIIIGAPLYNKGTVQPGQTNEGRALVFYDLALPSPFNRTAPGNGISGVPLSPILSWDTSMGTDNYEYCLTTTPTCTETDWIDAQTIPSVSLSGLVPYTTYYWHVRAVNDQGTTYANGSETGMWSFHTGHKILLPFVIR